MFLSIIFLLGAYILGLCLDVMEFDTIKNEKKDIKKISDVFDFHLFRTICILSASIIIIYVNKSDYKSNLKILEDKNTDLYYENLALKAEKNELFYVNGKELKDLELKPCPFCGSEDIRLVYDIDKTYKWTLECQGTEDYDNCDIEINAKDIYSLTEKWNKRNGE